MASVHPQKRKLDATHAQQLNTSYQLLHRNAKKEKPSTPNKEVTHAPPLGKFLASNNKATRDKAINELRKFLGGEEGVIEEIFEKELPEDIWETIDPKDEKLNSIELAKVYKGLFYCYWMSDKPIVQQELAKEISNLNLIIVPKKIKDSTRSSLLLDQVFITQTALNFWKGFWKTLEFEWHSIDRHRQDKYLLLMRSFVNSAFKILQRVNWHPKAIDMWSNILKETVFNVADFKTPLSVTYHYSDIFLEELNRVLTMKPELKAPIDLLLDPILYGLSQSRAGTATFNKIIENVFDTLFENFNSFISNNGNKSLKSNTIQIFLAFKSSLKVSSNSSSSSSSSLKTPTSASASASASTSTSSSSSSSSSSDNQSSLQIRNSLLSLLFNTGADSKCLDSNRKKIYNYWKLNGGVSDDQVEEET